MQIAIVDFVSGFVSSLSVFYVQLDTMYKGTLSFMYFCVFAFIYLRLCYVWAFFFF
jgi:hypothetical protein